MSELTDAAPKPMKRPGASAPPPPPQAAEPARGDLYGEEPPRQPNPGPNGAISALTGDGFAPSQGTAVAVPMGLFGEPEPSLMPGFVRKPFGAMEQKLAWEERVGYHRHWFNDPPDKPGRIEEAYNAGYSHVRDKTGRPIVRTVGRGGLKAYLMECPATMWLADMAAQERINRNIESAIRGGKLSRNPDDDDTRYVPPRGIRFEDE